MINLRDKIVVVRGVNDVDMTLSSHSCGVVQGGYHPSIVFIVRIFHYFPYLVDLSDIFQIYSVLNNAHGYGSLFSVNMFNGANVTVNFKTHFLSSV